MLERDANGTDLSRLNHAERRVLRMLAEGHTAKSVANAIGSTPAAVNERLREARRKTGVGSSRELARLLKSQENRDDQLGVDNSDALSTTSSHPDAYSWRRRKGMFVMIGLITVVIGAALMSDTVPTPDHIDPIIGEALPKFADPAELHQKVRTETRDPTWAARMEDAIKARVSEIPLVGKNGNTLRVLCARTLCEIGGTLIAPTSKSELEDQNSQFNRTTKELQVPPLTDDLGKLGLKSEAGMFTGGKGEPDRSVFLLYYSRAK